MTEYPYSANGIEYFNRVINEFKKQIPSKEPPKYLLTESEMQEITIKIFNFIHNYPNGSYNITPERIDAFKRQTPTLDDNMIIANLKYIEILECAFFGSIVYAVKKGFLGITLNEFVNGLDELKKLNIPSEEIDSLKYAIIFGIKGMNQTDNIDGVNTY